MNIVQQKGANNKQNIRGEMIFFDSVKLISMFIVIQVTNVAHGSLVLENFTWNEYIGIKLLICYLCNVK